MTATLRPRRTVARSANRLVAASIDLAAVGLPALTVAALTAERFPLLGPSSGPHRFGPADRQRVAEIGQGPHRVVEWDGWLYAFDPSASLATIGTVGGVAALALVVIPALTGGRSPGKAVTGLRVTADDGRPATAAQHLVRALAAPIDLLPFVVPGLVAAVSARTDSTRRRVGDRLASTLVIHGVDGWTVEADDRPQEPQVRPETGLDLGAGAPRGHDGVWGGPLAGIGEAIVLTGRDGLAPRRAAPSVAEPSSPAPPLYPSRRHDGSATRSPRSRRGATRAEIDLAEPSSEPSARSSLGEEADYRRWDGGRPDDRQASNRPQVEPAVSKPFDALVLPESSLAEGPMVTTASTDRIDRTDHIDEVAPDPPAGGQGDPLMWDRRRLAWVYRDETSGRRYRHDTATGRWARIDDS